MVTLRTAKFAFRKAKSLPTWCVSVIFMDFIVISDFALIQLLPIGFCSPRLFVLTARYVLKL